MFRSNVHIALQQVDDTELFAASKFYAIKPETQRDAVKIFKFFSPLYFANAEQFKQQLYAKTFNPKHAAASAANGKVDVEAEINANERKTGAKVRAVVLDCSAISYIDFMGLQTLKKIHAELKTVDTHLLLATCHHDVKSKLVTACPDLKGAFYPSVQDAVAVAQHGQLVTNGDTNV